ncbi:dTDP-4-dehydrorhamnose 3,5-epimerase family protein [Streptomyces sp. NPDC006645]|uniref:dTDP-4-dehydrorhamnose 3,5-epimerase family protein n=1 Tax=unclassified Streptomyces TaxID=2593676 RepID=UPI0033B4D2A2
MRTRQLDLDGAVEFRPPVHRDERGDFVSPFTAPDFSGATGRPDFPVAQISYSTSSRGTVRGIHFTRHPPGMAKYVCCLRGAALDFVVDLRQGSPTFGRWESVRLDGESKRALYLPVGIGHAFLALQDDTLMSYAMSGAYVPENELSVSPLDPDLALPIPADLEPVMSDRDRTAPRLADQAANGMLPDYAACVRNEGTL